MPALDLEPRSLGTRELVEGMLQAENTADWAVWRRLVAEDIIIDHPTLGPQVGIEPNLELIRRFREAVDDYRRDIVDLVCDETSAAFRFSITGVLARPVGDVHDATGDSFEIAGAAFVSTWGGRVVRIVEILTTNTLRSPGGGSG